jgi:hypothetical protein
MQYRSSAIPDSAVPRAEEARWQHALDIYVSEVNKVHATWIQFVDADLAFRPHQKSATAGEIMRHELLSQRRFFSEFLELPEPPAAEVLPAEVSVAAFAERLVEQVNPRLQFLATQSDEWWLATRPFFDT